ncbi:MAG: helix-turn-helix domain-containing GNAT family N-acetyltransferase [Pseudomonadota bacterium]
MPDARIDTIRRFNRFYTRRIGVLHEGLLDSNFTLTESRLLWELAHRDDLTAAELSRTLELDAGYLSRLLTAFKTRGLIRSTRSTDDGRQQHLSLTPAGRRAFAPLDTRSRQDVAALLSALDETQQQHLLASMTGIERLLASPGERSASPCTLRPHRAGDIGWVVSRHGALYAGEYGWDMRFEALVARIAADFIDRFDPAREACWIAERDGVPVGSVFLVQARDDASAAPIPAPIPGTAQLRMLLIEPSARGLGLGKRLVEECTQFARRAGYQKIMLWTNASLLAARGIYATAGYVLTHSEPHRSFGHDLVGETWELAL